VVHAFTHKHFQNIENPQCIITLKEICHTGEVVQFALVFALAQLLQKQALLFSPEAYYRHWLLFLFNAH
jgi:hypothetical protein